MSSWSARPNAVKMTRYRWITISIHPFYCKNRFFKSWRKSLNFLASGNQRKCLDQSCELWSRLFHLCRKWVYRQHFAPSEIVLMQGDFGLAHGMVMILLLKFATLVQIEIPSDVWSEVRFYGGIGPPHYHVFLLMRMVYSFIISVFWDSMRSLVWTAIMQ